MKPRFLAHFEEEESRTRLLYAALFFLIGIGFLGITFFSPVKIMALTAAIGLIVFTLLRPTAALVLLLWYLPFEPFLLKWVPDDLYVYARYGSELLLYFVILSAAARWLIDRRSSPTPVTGPFALLIISMLASVLVNLVPPLQAVIGLRMILRFALLFFAVVVLAPPKAVRTMLVKGLIAIALLQAGLGYAQSIVGGPLDRFLLPSERKTLGSWQLTGGTVQFWDPGERVFGTLGRYDQLGAFLAMIVIFIAALLYARLPRDERGRNLLLAILVVLLPALILTYSRSAWFGAALGFLAIALWIKRDGRVLALSLLIPTLLGAYLFVSNVVVSNLVEGYGRQTVADRFLESFSYERWRGEYYGLGRVYWAVQTVATVVPHAPLFGFGPGSYGGGAVAALGNAKVYDALGLPFGVYGSEGYVDNNWLSLWGELGTIGLGFYLWFYLGLAAFGYRLAKSQASDEVRAIGMALFGFAVCLMLNASLATMLEVRTAAPYFWVLAGLAVVAAREERIEV